MSLFGDTRSNKPTAVGLYIDLYRELCGTTPLLNNQECEVITRLVGEYARPEAADIERLKLALRAFVQAEDAWRRQKSGMPEGFFDDPLADAYRQAKEALAELLPQSRST